MRQCGVAPMAFEACGNPRRKRKMAVTIFVVRATITKDKEAAFNKWYNE